MSSEPKQTPYIYQPYGIQNRDHWASKRIYAVASDSMLTTLSGLTKEEAEKIMRALKSQPDSSSIPEIELELRRMMWLGHGHTGMYGDDGEMQCGECQPFGVVDYKREPLDKVRETFRAVQMERMMKPRDSSSISSEQMCSEAWEQHKRCNPDFYSNANRDLFESGWNAAKGQSNGR